MSSEQNLWSFIKTRKATQSASLKILQQFVLSLNKHELRHLIESYLKSKLSQNDSEPLTYKAAANKLLNNNNNNINKLDKEILIKLNKKYGNKYNKKIVAKIQQKKTNKKMNKHLLWIHPQVLSYSFQYLSFKELSKIQTVCLYFTYLHKKYQGLTHFYLKMDKKFCLNAMRNVINLKWLKQFKHIDIEYAYNSRVPWDKDQERRSKLFEHILKVIMSQSIGNLNVLSIDTYFKGYNLRKSFNVLLFIMNEFNYLPITKLIWKNDVFIPSQNSNIQSIYKDIKSKINITFPKLQQFSFKHKYEYQYLFQRQQCLIPPIIKSYNLLSLDLTSIHFNIFKINNNLIQLIIENLKHLEKLSIGSRIDGDEILPAMHCMNNNNANINVTVKQLNVHFFFSYRIDAIQRNKSIQNALSTLFSVFIGIEMFEFQCYSISIDWQQLLSKLFQHKHMYSIQNGSISYPLKSLQFNGSYSYEICENIINGLTKLKDEIYFDLKHFGIKMSQYAANSSLSQFIENYFVPFIKSFNSLNHIVFINYGYNKLDCSYLEPMLKLLCNIPKSLKSMEITMPYFQRNQGKIKQIASTKLVQKLCELLSEKDNEWNLERIVFDGIEITKKPKEFLEFFFGYNQKLFIQKQKYYLTFI